MNFALTICTYKAKYYYYALYIERFLVDCRKESGYYFDFGSSFTTV